MALRKKIIYSVLFALLGYVSYETYGYVLEDSSLKNFRTSYGPYDASRSAGASRVGLDSLRISGSGALRERTLLQGMKQTGAKPSDIYIIDLLGENETFIDGRPSHWFNWVVKDGVIEAPYKTSLSFSSLRDNWFWALRRALYPYPKKPHIESEEQMAHRMGYHYLNLSVVRKQLYPPKTVDLFIEFVQNLPPEAWLHFHCYSGCSRTTSLMIIYDILKNGDKVPFDEIVERQWALGGTNINDTKPRLFGATWKKEALIKRKAMLEDFYTYRNDPEGYGKLTWSEWLEKNGKMHNWKPDLTNKS